MAVASKIVTYEEWLLMPETQDALEEVVNGEIRIMPPNKWSHAMVVHNVRTALEGQLGSGVIVVDTIFGLIIHTQPLTSRIPDIAVFRKQNILERDGYIHSAPDLLAEVLSPGNTRAEMVEKLADYESIGAPEVWILSPEARTLEILHLIDGKLQTAAILREGQVHPRLFPEAVVDVATVWPD